MKHWADEYVGIPYRFHGIEKDGLDCLGLVRMVYRDKLGVAINTETVSRETNLQFVSDIFQRYAKAWNKVGSPREFDVVLLNVTGIPCHCGIMIDAGRFLHVMSGGYSCVEASTSMKWARRIEGFYRLEY